MTVLVELVDELVDVAVGLGTKRAASIRRAPSRAISSSNDVPVADAPDCVSFVACTTLSMGVPSQPALPRRPA
jgi:hypothetical protein